MTFGCVLSASTAALAKNGRNVRFTPSRSANAALARARRAAILVTSTSWVWVSWAVSCSDSRVFLAVI
ncbi:Uncharacterised protein [Mycobacteroides abscessus subsp. abscessus]|nr:Uncharacterised protein [Mycobacteroides abscessus subsp. abscessus]SKW60377.1 Uncharacterised protein [Mycobacteroides abscessus subsp. abscessus]